MVTFVLLGLHAASGWCSRPIKIRNGEDTMGQRDGSTPKKTPSTQPKSMERGIEELPTRQAIVPTRQSSPSMALASCSTYIFAFYA